MRRVSPWILSLVVLAGQATAGVLEFDLQRREPASGKVFVTKERVDPTKTAIVIVDMWDYHWCRTARERSGALIPRMNEAFDRARALGFQVIHLPTEVTVSHEGAPQREAVLALPRQLLPKLIDFNPQDPRSGGCMCGPGPRCMYNYGHRAINPKLRIRDADLIAHEAQEMVNICRAKDISLLLYAGVATNQCLLRKPGALLQMTRYGLKCWLLRDQSDSGTEYDPQHGYTPDVGSAEVVEDIERYITGTVDLVAELKKAGRWQDSLMVDSVFITPWGRVFEDEVVVSLAAPRNPEAGIRYTLDGTEPSESSLLYTAPFTVTETRTVKTAAFQRGKAVTHTGKAEFLQLPPYPPEPEVYLSDREPAFSATIGFPYYRKDEPNADRSIGGNPLKVRRKEYRKGLGVHTVSKVVYDLRPEYARFVALGGVDDEILGEDVGRFRAGYARAVFQVFIDDKLAGASPLIGAQHVPWGFNIEIPAGSRRIMLVVTDGRDDPFALASENLTFYNYLGHADWLNAGFLLKGSPKQATSR